MQEEYKNKKAIAVYCSSAFTGILILDIQYNINDFVIFCDEIDGKRGKVLKSQIRYTVKNKAYFIHYKHRYYLDEFLKA